MMTAMILMHLFFGIVFFVGLVAVFAGPIAVAIWVAKKVHASKTGISTEPA